MIQISRLMELHRLRPTRGLLNPFTLEVSEELPGETKLETFFKEYDTRELVRFINKHKGFLNRTPNARILINSNKFAITIQ